MKRYAIVKNARDREQLEAYLPGNYAVIYEYIGARYFEDDDRPYGQGGENGTLSFVIAGEDNAGWTFDDYVEPRLASGLIYAKEIGLDHNLFKQIPVS